MGNVNAATITNETVAVWNQEVQQARSSLHKSRSPVQVQPASFDLGHGHEGKIMSVVSPEGRSRPIPSGYLHTWVGRVFIPEARAAELVSVLQDYPAYKDVYSPAVVSAELLTHNQETFQYRLKFVQKGFGVKAALLGTFQSEYEQVNSREGYSVTEATELTELRNVEGGGEEAVPQAKARGFVERSFTIVRYREVAGGTEVEVEALTLSREIPGSIRWIAMPLVRKFAAQTMTATLVRLSDRVQTVAAHRNTASTSQAPQHESFLERP